jgi:penicillin-binding protein 1A
LNLRIFEPMAQEETNATPKAKPAKKKFRRLVIFFWIVLLAPVVSLLGLIVGIALFAELPDIEQLQNPESSLATVIYSSDGKELGRFYAENRVTVKFKKIDQDVIHALIATEDERFYGHSGVDLRGLGRAVLGMGKSGGGSTITQQLAKMQFHQDAEKKSFSERVFQKLKEWIIAIRLERLYTKDEIIALYLNKYDFNYNAVGIKSAAKVYFSTSQDSLKIEEAAVLIGMCQNPSRWNPILNPNDAVTRRNVVLFQMKKNNYITQAAYDSLKKLPIEVKFNPESHNEGLAPYFREYLRDNFLKTWCSEHLKPDGKPYNMYRDGLRIYTTIDSRMQGYAEEAVDEHMEKLQGDFDKTLKKKRNAPFSYRVTKAEIDQIMKSAKERSDRYIRMKKAGATEAQIEKAFTTPVKMRVFNWKGDKDTMMTPMDSIRYYKAFLQTGFMAMEPQTGYIRAWVGGIDFRHFKYDHVKESKRQVGSTFKPFVYALAIQEGYTPCDEIPCVRTCITTEDGKEWCPSNSGGKADAKLEGRMITLRKALALSLNYISAYLMKQFGPASVIEFARNVGITSKLDPNPSLCLGTADISLYEMVGGINTFANKGTWIEPTFVTRIEDKNGIVLEEFIPKSREVMSEEKAYIMVNLMQGVVQFGTGSRLNRTYGLSNPIAGKTGTTQNNSDGWFIGMTPDLVAGAWVGADDRSVHFDLTEQGQGAAMALPIWALFYKKVYADKSIKISKGAFDRPSHKIMINMDCRKLEEDDENDPGLDPTFKPIFGEDEE